MQKHLLSTYSLNSATLLQLIFSFFQLTVAKQHPVKADLLNAITPKTNKTKPIEFQHYFAVPDDIFPEFNRKQHAENEAKRVSFIIENIEQYALCLPPSELNSTSSNFILYL